MSLFQKVHTQTRRVGLSQTIRFLERKEKVTSRWPASSQTRGRQPAPLVWIAAAFSPPLGYYTERDLGNPAPPRLQRREPSYFYRTSPRWLTFRMNTPHSSGDRIPPPISTHSERAPCFPPCMSPSTGKKFWARCPLTSSPQAPLEAEEKGGWVAKATGAAYPCIPPPLAIGDCEKNDWMMLGILQSGRTECGLLAPKAPKATRDDFFFFFFCKRN